MHGQIRFLEDAQSVEFCHPLNDGTSGWTLFRPPNENSRGWPTTTTKTTTTQTTATTATATTATVTTTTTTTPLAFVEVEQKSTDWALVCSDSGPWASVVDDARTIDPSKVDKNKHGWWMGSSRAPWGGYGCLEAQGMNSFWNGSPTDYWRASGACAPACAHDRQAFEFVRPPSMNSLLHSHMHFILGRSHVSIVRVLERLRDRETERENVSERERDSFTARARTRMCTHKRKSGQHECASCKTAPPITAHLNFCLLLLFFLFPKGVYKTGSHYKNWNSRPSNERRNTASRIVKIRSTSLDV